MSLLWLIASLLADVPPVVTECICARAKVHDGWCDPCGFGFVAGLKIPSKLLFTVIDHGHDLDPSFVRCDSCRNAMETDGFCDKCNMGFFKKKLYLSPFTHFLALSDRVQPDQIKCQTCLKNMEEGGWCDACKRGVFGNVATTRRALFDEAVAAFHRLKIGLANLKPCEICGVAMYSNGMCPKHRMVYRDGKGTPE
jgi:hypothetical protein